MSISPRAAQTKWLSHLTHNSHLNANSTNEYLYSGGLLFEPFRDVEEIPFPRLTVIWRKSLAPYGAFFVPRIPAENDEDGFAIERVFAKKMAHAALVERTDDGRIDLSHVAGDPLETPKSCLRVE
jgi:hypothetical protein